MLIIDQTLIGRKYYILDKNTQYTIRGIADGTGTVVLIGEYNNGTDVRLTTTKVTDAKLL
jgi:hypothetical protein